MKDASERTERARSFDAFASYCTIPDYALVRKTEAFLEGFHTFGFAKKLGLRPLHICVDGSDFSLLRSRNYVRSDPIPDPLKAVVHEHLEHSAILLVFCSKRSPTQPWIIEEIRWWLDNRDAESVFLIVTEGANPVADPSEVFPTAVRDHGINGKPWYDFRGFRGRIANGWSKVRDPYEERVRLAAHLYGETAGHIYPTWIQIRDRRRRLARFGQGLTGLLAVAVLSYYVWTLSDRYQIGRIVADPPVSTIGPYPDYLVALVKAGELAAAKRAASFDDSHRLSLLSIIGAELMKERRLNEARAVYIDALKLPIGDTLISEQGSLGDMLGNAVISGVNDETSRQMFQQVLRSTDVFVGTTIAVAAEKIAQSGFFAQALQIADQIPDRANRLGSLVRIATLNPDHVAAKRVLDHAREILGHRVRGQPFIFDEAFLVAADLSKAYAKIGDLDSAMSAAGEVQSEEASVYSEIAYIFAQSGDWASASRALEAVPITVRARESKFRIEEMAANGKIDDALRFAEAVTSQTGQRAEFFFSIATDLEQAGIGRKENLDAARRFFESGAKWTTAGKVDAEIILMLARGQLLSGNLAGTRGLLVKAHAELAKTGEWSQAPALAQLQLRAGATQDEMIWTAQIPDPSIRSSTYRALAEEAIASHRQQLPKKFIEAIEDKNSQQQVYESWLSERTTAGDVDSALSIAKSIDNVGRRGAMMRDAVLTLIKEHEPAKALAIAREIPLFAQGNVSVAFDEDRYLAYAKLAPALAESGRIQDALSLVHEIPVRTLSVRALGGIAATELVSKSTRDQKTISVRAIRDADSITESDTRIKLLGELVSDFCQVRAFEQATAAVNLISGEEARSPFRRVIAETFANVGQLRRARLEAVKIVGTSDRAKAYCAILERFGRNRHESSTSHD